jgi:microcystin degradation protein MlrC
VRVGVVALLHESNTFASVTTPLRKFEEDLLITGEPVRERLAGTHHEVGGFFEQLAEDRIEAVPVFAARATPSGTIERKAAGSLVKMLLDAVRRAGPLDGWLVAPHGAAVAEGEPDFDGHWLTTLRQEVGTGVPVIGTLDLHANVSPRMVAATDALVAYRTNPHLDQRERGREAATLLVRTLRGEIRPRMAAAFPPMAVNIEAQATAEWPCRELYDAADSARGGRDVLSISLVLGFPYSDVAEMGPSVLVVANNDSEPARHTAESLAGMWWDRRAAFQGRRLGVEEAVREAAGSTGTVGLLDMGDNVGGGSPADGTLLAHEILRQGVTPACVCLNDPEVVRQATGAGTGAKLTLTIGGKADNRHGTPLTATFTVRGLYDGKFEETEVRHGGVRSFDQGPTALVESDTGLTVVVTSRRTAPFSLRQLTAFGVEPGKFRVLVIKGVHAPVAAYAPVCSRLIRVNTPGITTADLGSLTFHHRRKPLYPFEPDIVWTPEAVGP